MTNKTPFDGSLMIAPSISRLTARRQACSKRGFSTSYRTNKSWTEGQVSDDKGAAILQHFLPDNSTFLADGGYDATWLLESLKARGMTVCMPPRKTGNEAFPFDNTLYKQRYLIENTFSRLKDWRRIATRYDRCAHTFFSAICLAVTVIFYLN